MKLIDASSMKLIAVSFEVSGLCGVGKYVANFEAPFGTDVRVGCPLELDEDAAYVPKDVTFIVRSIRLRLTGPVYVPGAFSMIAIEAEGWKS